MVLGKHSGRHAFDARLSELGYALTKDELDTAFAKFKQIADRKKDVTDSDLEAIVTNRSMLRISTSWLPSMCTPPRTLTRSV
jgi:2-isopropylmalate synthase